MPFLLPPRLTKNNFRCQRLQRQAQSFIFLSIGNLNIFSGNFYNWRSFEPFDLPFCCLESLPKKGLFFSQNHFMFQGFNCCFRQNFLAPDPVILICSVRRYLEIWSLLDIKITIWSMLGEWSVSNKWRKFIRVLSWHCLNVQMLRVPPWHIGISPNSVILSISCSPVSETSELRHST